MSVSSVLQKTTWHGAIWSVLALTASLLLYTTAIYISLLPADQMGVGVCMAVAGLAGGWKSSAGQGRKLPRALLGGLSAYLLLLLLLLLRESGEPMELRRLLTMLAATVFGILSGVMLRSRKVVPTGKQRKHNPRRKRKT